MIKKTIILIVCAIFLLSGLQANNKSQNTSKISVQTAEIVDTLAVDSIVEPPQEATMVFDTQEYHLGLIKDNTKPTTYSFFYCNVGQQGLLIKRIEATCGCQVTQYPTDSLFYDQSGQIDVEIAPCKEAGKFKKGIYVYTNAGTFRLVVSGEFAFADYSHEDYSAIPSKEEEEMATEKKDKPIRQKKNKLSRKTKRLND
ncbi:MAG: DUF1573 domain-containing protein [Paludibacteraceae bacterium]|nr:DUF1573 domain-containing protein [Paludibacteraceae bacterium]